MAILGKVRMHCGAAPESWVAGSSTARIIHMIIHAETGRAG